MHVKSMAMVFNLFVLMELRRRADQGRQNDLAQMNEQQEGHSNPQAIGNEVQKDPCAHVVVSCKMEMSCQQFSERHNNR
jgi:hypothetical protein